MEEKNFRLQSKAHNLDRGGGRESASTRGQWRSGRGRSRRGTRGESSEKRNFLPDNRPSRGEARRFPQMP
eukprot:16430579-Heterocapsa_arctica.AAC.1